MANTNDHGGIATVFFDSGDTLGTGFCRINFLNYYMQ